MTKNVTKVTKVTKVNKTQTRTMGYPKSIDLYKIDQKVTVRKPRAKAEGKNTAIHFVSEITDKTMLPKVKEFIKHVYTDIKELNFLQKDMGFLISDIYGKDNGVNTSVDVNNGRIFFTWVYVPFIAEKDKKESHLPKSIKQNIFPYDIFYLRQTISDSDCKGILSWLRKKIDAHVYVRHPFETPLLPYDIKVV